MSSPFSHSVKSPRSARSTLDGILAIANSNRDELRRKKLELGECQTFLDRAPAIDLALQELSGRMFDQLVDGLQTSLTNALQEVLEQPIELKAVASYKRGAMNIDFHIEREGHEEDIMKGQGGSVANVLSVGLRLYALSNLDATKHRRFLVLDEQDCWLRPEIVPRLVKIVREACDVLGFQVLMISHHDPKLFEDYAERIYTFSPRQDGSVEVSLKPTRSSHPDVGAY